MEDLAAVVEVLKSKKERIESRLGDPAVVADQPTFQQLSKEHAHLSRIVMKYSEYDRVSSTIEEDRRLMEEAAEDNELRTMLEDEIASLEENRSLLHEELQDMLRPDSKDDDRDTIVEIRAGTGGAEACLFAGDLFRMYSRYADSQGWKLVTMNSHPTELGGFKEIVFEVSGISVYRKLKFESGVHRVQRIPVTEAGGRIHTSAVSVAVLAEPDPVEVEIDPKDVRIDVFRASGHGGQSVNTMDSAVRITHLPTKIIVQCQDERSQRQNKEKAMRHLRAKLLEIERARQENETAQARRAQIQTGDRSEKIRTYNFPQNRVTDHRIGLTVYALDAILDGDLDQLIAPSLASQRNAASLEKISKP